MLWTARFWFSISWQNSILSKPKIKYERKSLYDVQHKTGGCLNPYYVNTVSPFNQSINIKLRVINQQNCFMWGSQLDSFPPLFRMIDKSTPIPKK